MDERRQFHRYLLFTEIEHEAMATHDQGRAQTKDISRGGLCLTTEGEPLLKDGQYRLTFLLPFTEEAIDVTARVMWSRRDGELWDNGLTFVDIDKKYLELIEEYSIGSVEQPEERS
jgi:hypothetical protein